MPHVRGSSSQWPLGWASPPALLPSGEEAAARLDWWLVCAARCCSQGSSVRWHPGPITCVLHTSESALGSTLGLGLVTLWPPSGCQERLVRSRCLWLRASPTWSSLVVRSHCLRSPSTWDTSDCACGCHVTLTRRGLKGGFLSCVLCTSSYHNVRRFHTMCVCHVFFHGWFSGGFVWKT